MLIEKKLNSSQVILLSPNILDAENWNLLKEMLDIDEDVDEIYVKVESCLIPRKNKEG